MDSSITAWLLGVAETMPISVFIFVGSAIEELLPLIPSPFVMTTAGALAKAQEYNWVGLFFLIVLASVIKTFYGWVWYRIADKAEDVVVGNYGKSFGISHQRLESIGKRLSKGVGDEAAIIVLRAIPIIPSSLVSIMAGFIKLDVKSFVWTTFLGMLVRNLIFLLIGMGLLELAI